MTWLLTSCPICTKNLEWFLTAAAAIKRQIPLCCCLNACYMCIRNGFIPSSCWVGRQAREAATCAFIIYKRMNIKDYDGKPSRILDNSRFVLNFFSGTYLIYSTNANSQAHLCISESSATQFFSRNINSRKVGNSLSMFWFWCFIGFHISRQVLSL